DSALNVNAVSATAGQNVFNINNSLSNSIFSVRHMNANFGSLVTAGAFMQKDSYFGEEFNTAKGTNCAPSAATGTAVNAWARGDLGGGGTGVSCSLTAATTGTTGELSFTTSTPNTGATSFSRCTAASPGATTANGVE